MDREKVIKGLHQHCEGSLFGRCGKCPYYETDYGSWGENKFKCRDELLEDVHALLKEQPGIIRCKDCIHWEPERKGYCPYNHIFTVSDWFCADSVAKDINVPNKD